MKALFRAMLNIIFSLLLIFAMTIYFLVKKA